MSRFIKKHMKWLVVATAVILSPAMVLGTATSILALDYDLTTDNPTMTYTINSAIWERFQPDTPTGTGNFNTFHQVKAKWSKTFERGYNTDYRPKQFDEGSWPHFNRSLLLSDVPQVMVGGVIYREFQLDIDERDSAPNWYISLDQFQVWVTNNPSITGYIEGIPSGSFPSGADLIYDLGGNSIKMDFRANDGSGKRDYRVLVPQSLFDGKTGIYVVLFTRHGDTWSTDDGFEEWGVRILDATKAGYKFNDLNADGVWDPNGIDDIPGNADDEAGLNDWTINLVGEDYKHHAMSTVTANDGSGHPGYHSFSVPAGTYTVSEELQPGWIQSYPTTGSPVGTYQVILGNGQLDLDNHFGNWQPGSLKVTKTANWSGVTPDPTKTFEICITGPSYPTGNCQTADYDGDTLTWNNLIPGSYNVTETDPGTEWTVVVTGSPATVVSGGAASASVSNTAQMCIAEIGDLVWDDANRNGTKDGGEDGLANITASLLNEDDRSLVATTATNVTGWYLFPDLEAGNYIVDVDERDDDMPYGYFTSTYNDPMKVPLAACEKFLDADFGYGPDTGELGIIGDLVWNDANRDGDYDPNEGERGIPFVRLILKDVNRIYLRETGTDWYGNYFFYNNEDGIYYVEVDRTDPDLKGYDALSTDWEIMATIASNFLDADFGCYTGTIQELASIGGYVWKDTNLDGIQNDGATGTSGIEVQLWKPAGVTHEDTTTTDANGYYLFDELEPGEY